MNWLVTTSLTASTVRKTDNVKEFACVFDQSRVPGDGGSLTLAGIAPRFDGILCSSDTGALKRDPGGRFFSAWAAGHALAHGDILLIDDRERNCAAWREAGGAAICWQLGQDPLDDLSEAVAGWLDRGGRARPARPV